MVSLSYAKLSDPSLLLPYCSIPRCLCSCTDCVTVGILKILACVSEIKLLVLLNNLKSIIIIIIIFFLKPPTIVCSICKRDGHSKNDCPEDFKKIDLKPLPPMTDRFREILDIVCKRCFGKLEKHLHSTVNCDL